MYLNLDKSTSIGIVTYSQLQNQEIGSTASYKVVIFSIVQGSSRFGDEYIKITFYISGKSDPISLYSYRNIVSILDEYSKAQAEAKKNEEEIEEKIILVAELEIKRAKDNYGFAGDVKGVNFIGFVKTSEMFIYDKPKLSWL